LDETKARRDPNKNFAAIPQTGQGCPFAIRDIPRFLDDGTLTVIDDTVVQNLNRSLNRITQILYEADRDT
jgi:hypothetical protein